MRRFWSNEKGNMIIMFALALVPVMGLMGAAIDYSRASLARTKMQGALDSTGLFLSRLPAGTTQEELNTKGTQFFYANYNETDVLGIQLAFTPALTPGKLNLTAVGTYNPVMVNIVGVTSFPVGTKTEVKWGNKRLRVALVLDTTGSMASAGKIEALKTATKNLLEQLKNSVANADDIYVSIIPFSKDVAVAPSNYTANWIDWTAWEAPPPYMATWLANSTNKATWALAGPGSTCPFTNASHGFRCSSTPITGSAVVGTIPSSGAYSGYICPSIDNGSRISTKNQVYYNGCYTTKLIASGSTATCGALTEAQGCYCGGSDSNRRCQQHIWREADTAAATARSTWNGCLIDRGNATPPGTTADNDQKIVAPSAADVTTLFPAEQYGLCSPPAMALNNNWTTMKNYVDSFFTAGATNQPIGLAWGWLSLGGGGPFPAAPPKDPNYVYQDAIILMSDGLNTQNRWYGTGTTTNTSVDARMLSPNSTTGIGTCKNVKDAGIKVYTVHVNTSGDPLSTLLRNCASSTDKFWMITSAGELDMVFNNIGAELSSLHLSY